MIERLLIVAGVLLASLVAYLLVRGYLALRRRRLLEIGLAPTVSRSAGEKDADRPTIVYFSTAACGRCRDQARALEDLDASLFGQVQVRKVDALAEPGLAAAYDVLTVPTTVVLDGAARPRAVNYGYAPASKLEAQLREVLPRERVAA